jgi:hypothetical protein
LRTKWAVMCAGLMLALAGRGEADEGRGFVIGGGLGPTRLNFGGAQGLVLVLGDSLGRIEFRGGDSLELRAGVIVPRTLLPSNVSDVVPVPAHQNGGVLSIQIGYSFSRRLALLADFDLNGGWDNSFNQVMGAAAVRYSPARRIWLEAGPASGDLSYGFGSAVAQNVAGSGYGFLAAGGVVLMQKSKFQMDVQARSGTLWFDRFRITNVSVQIGVMRRRS